MSLAITGCRASSSHFAFGALFIAALSASAIGQTADSLPAFKPDSAVQDPFRQVEAGPSAWSAGPADSAPKSRADSLAKTDTVTDRLRKRHPAISAYLGVNFIDLDEKAAFKAALETRRAVDKLEILQDYESVHLAFPFGIQAVVPIGGYLDLVAKTHSYWYKQTAILGDSNRRYAGDESFAVQANLGGLGLRYYIPPSLLSVTGGLGLYAQGLLYWNLGNAQIYTPYGNAKARFEALGSAYEIQFGMQQAMTGPWKISGAIGFLQQDFKSGSPWSDILKHSPPTGKVSWGSSAIQATLNLWYHFGAVSDTAAAKTAIPAAGSQPGPVGQPGAGGQPAPAALPAPADSSRRF